MGLLDLDWLMKAAGSQIDFVIPCWCGQPGVLLRLFCDMYVMYVSLFVFVGGCTCRKS